MNKKMRILQGVVLIGIVAFILSFLLKPGDSTTPFQTVVDQTIQSIDTEQYNLEDHQNVRRFLGLDSNNYENIAYYKHKDDMEASEVVIIQFSDDSQVALFEEAVENRMKNQENIYGGYLPKQASLVKRGVVFVQANYGVYIVNEKADTMLSNFKEALKKGDTE